MFLKKFGYFETLFFDIEERNLFRLKKEKKSHLYYYSLVKIIPRHFKVNKYVPWCFT